MNTSIHPYKGYLNTQFRVFVKGDEPLNFQVYSAEKEDIAILNGVIVPNQPHNIVMPHAGEFFVKFDDGSSHKFYVEDGYRYGGNKLKNAFIFDDCPWAFVIMRDRTYFYNRITQQSFMEPISPDEIEEVSTDYVIFKSDKQNELTLFSLKEQEPILWVDNVAFNTNKTICWEEKKENNIINLSLYSLSEQRIVSQITCDKYSFDNKNNALYYHSANRIHKIDLDSFDDIIVRKYFELQKFMTFVGTHYAVSYAKKKSKLYLFDLLTAEERGEVHIQGNLTRINDVRLINVVERAKAFRDFDFANLSIHEDFIQAQYTEIDLYPCDWSINERIGRIFRTLYAEKITTFQVSHGKYSNNFSKIEETNIKSLESNFSQPIDNIKGSVISNDNYFLFFNRNESLVIPRLYPRHTSYHKGKLFFRVGDTIVMKYDDEIRILNDKGFWDGHLVGNYDTSYLEKFKLLKNKENEIYYNLAGTEFGKFKVCTHSPYERLKIGDYAVFPGGAFITSPNIPQYLSPLGRRGLTITEKEVTLFDVRYHKVSKASQILQDIYETQNYTNVLLGENGKQVIFRDNKQAKMLDLVSGETFEFENLSYINHINGIRPFFRLLETSQALLINPVDGQPINFNLVSEYQFVSPDYKLYADKALDQYIEYFDHIQQRLISKEEYQLLYEKFSLLRSNDNERKKRIQNRKDFVIKHGSFLIDILREKGYKDISVEEFHKSIVDEKNTFGTSRFIDLFIEKRGVAVIKRISDNKEVERIPLGPPLWFLNYVSFSRDSRYVAIAGRYPHESNYSGLFLVYDLIEHKVILEDKSSYAVWTTAFADGDMVAAYTSTPNSFLGSATNPPRVIIENEKYPKDENFNVRGFNFLTFSPDGKFFACSRQGYLCYKKSDGTIRTNWGHQPSSLVSIRNSANPQTELLALHDLSDEGIADTNEKRSVASVSFSNDNSRIMMVGCNGVVVVRNIHL